MRAPTGPRRRRWRSRPTWAAAGVAVACALVLGALLWLAVPHYLVARRESRDVAQARSNAARVAAVLPATDLSLQRALARLPTGTSSVSLVRRSGGWLSSSLTITADTLPRRLRRAARRGVAAHQEYDGPGDGPRFAVAVPLRGEVCYVEVFGLGGLARVVAVLRGTAAGVAGLLVLGAFALLAWSRRRARAARVRTPTPVFGAAADVSHELRRPLTVIRGAVDLLREDEGAPDRRLVVDLLHGQVVQLHRLLEDVVDLSRAETGRPEVRQEPVAPVALAGSVLGPDRADLLRADDDAAKATLCTDPRRLERVLTNLVANADEHGQGLVELRVHVRDDEVRFVVDDRGPGVPADDRRRVFERFVKGPGSAGSGIGLSLVAGQVRLLGGRVRVDDRPGGGARFVVRLPLRR